MSFMRTGDDQGKAKVKRKCLKRIFKERELSFRKTVKSQIRKYKSIVEKNFSKLMSLNINLKNSLLNNLEKTEDKTDRKHET